jgi:hypothetical protein
MAKQLEPSSTGDGGEQTASRAVSQTTLRAGASVRASNQGENAMLFRRRMVDGEDARQGDGRELNLRVLLISTVVAAALLAIVFFAFGFGNEMFSTPGPVNPDVAAPPPSPN